MNECFHNRMMADTWQMSPGDFMITNLSFIVIWTLRTHYVCMFQKAYENESP